MPVAVVRGVTVNDSYCNCVGLIIPTVLAVTAALLVIMPYL